MKSKNFVLVFLFIAISCVGLWWFMRQKVAAPEKTAPALKSAKADAPKELTPLAQVELPKAPAVPASSSTLSANPLPDPNDPQADLKTAIPDIVHWLQAGDIFTFRKNYTPPNTFTPQQLEQMQEQEVQLMSNIAQSPYRENIQKALESKAKEFESLENQTPTYNSTGDEATYTYKRDPLIDGDDGQVTETFIKINGRWYQKI